jgi:hypothetical protein
MVLVGAAAVAGMLLARVHLVATPAYLYAALEIATVAAVTKAGYLAARQRSRGQRG